MSKECEGCNRYSTYCKIGLIPKISRRAECPCRTCLVKVMCVASCTDFRRYEELSREQRSISDVVDDFLNGNLTYYK